MDHNRNFHRRQQVSNHPPSASSYFTQPSDSHQSSGLKSQNGRSVNDSTQQQQIISRNAAPSPTNRRRHSTTKMTEPFSAAAVFTNNNNNNADGWGDDWGDWGDSNTPQLNQQPPPQQQQQHHQQQLPAAQPVPMMPPMGTNQYFQPQPQYPPQQTHLDQSNRNFMMNPAQPAFHQNYQQPPVQQNYYQQQQQQFVPAANSYVSQQPQRPPSHPPASTTPQQSFNQAITDSFDTSGGDTWNWSIGDQQPAAAPSPPRPAEVVQQPTNYSNYAAPNVPQNNFSLPGAGNNTQQQPLPPPSQQQPGPKVQVAQLTRLKNETLSPQWSIESQVSQTSSDRSIESGELGDTRSSNTVPSDDGSSGRQGVENYENVGPYPGMPGDVPDKLDEALNSLSIKQEPQQEAAPVEERRQDGGYRESSFPPPPPSIAGANQQADGATASLPPKSSSKTPPLPPMPTEAGGPPPPMQAGPPPKGPAGNPFKRTGQRAHIATPGLAPAPSTSPAYFYQPPPAPVVQPEITNLENPIPENQEIPDTRTENVENLEIAPSNDRNQYLQTGHLSEEGYTTSQPSNDPQPADDSLPPPGLSRYVPGQQQSEPNTQQTGHNFPEPPPGLDRMIPGTDLENATDLNMERQVDGEVSDSATSSARPSAHREQQITDRNLYLVPGESDTHHNQQRVIPGVEDDRYAPPQPQSQPPADIPINEQTRELVMDGENPHDPPPLPVEISREEPIEGGNTLDEPTSTSSAPPPPIDSTLAVEPPRKDPSNTSTADESDKDRSMFYSKSKQSASRRDEDPLRRSTKSKSSRDRYDTEDSDYSDRERRRREREGSDGHRDRKRGGEKEKERRKEGGRGERDRERDRGYDYRDRDRNRYDRERGDRDRYGRKYDRDSRYETDGSKYETERSTRYDKDGDGSKRYISREEYYRKREERGGGGGGEDHRRYRKEKDRERGGDRYREEGRKDDRYRDGDKRRDRHDRRYDYEDYRTGSRNGTERDRVRDSRERDERKDPRDPRSSKYPPTASSAYGPQYHPGTAAGYYDPYSYYTQHQQYYEQLRRTNPQAYAEWYRTYYSQMQAHQAAHIPRDMMAGDDRESVHSGRSSANDKERFNRTTPFLHQPPVMASGMYNPEDYHRHFNNQSQPSAMLDQSFLSDVSGQPTAASLYHHHQQQQQQMAFQQQQQHQQRATPLIMDRSYHTDSGYYQPRLDATDGSQLEVLEPERLTPRKFPEIHSIVSISSGLLVTAKNRITINGTTDFVKIFSLGTNEPTRKLFQSYPGPLVKDKTHKKSVIEFCEEQLRLGPPCMAGHTLIKSRGNSINSLHSFGSSANRGSFTLLWNYIILLLRQNGTFVGTDISELLMQNKLEFPFESVQASTRSTNVSGRNSSLSATVERRSTAAHGDAEGDGDDSEQHVVAAAAESAETSAGTDLEMDKKEPLSELEITDKFRNYLIYGNISEALEWATENNLWGHALFLASKVDSRQHANVMMKFANKLTLNDPLQTLYQLLSGRTPSSVTCVLDEKWGDWRPHLAMLMSNSSAKPELIKKSITTLGDSLYNRGDLYGAHFCYLLSDVTFGRFADVKVESGATVTANTMVRLILLGSCHMQRTFKEFSTNESIMMTEIYEYARSLNEERYSITELQYYKYLLASRMLDYGMQLKCLLYMEQLAEQIQLDPYRFDSEFIRKVYTLGDRLKYYDPVLEKELDESVDNHGHGNIYTNVEDPAWLQRLSAILINYNSPNTSNYAPQQTSYDNGQPDYSNNTSQYNSYTGYSTEQRPGAGQEQLQQQPYGIDPTEINNEFTKINHQLGQLNLQYTEGFDSQQQQQQQQPTPTHNQYEHSMAAPSYDQGYDSINQSSLPEEQKQPEGYDQLQSAQQQPYSYGSYDGSSGQPSLFVPSPVPAGQEQQQQQQQQDQQSSPYNYWGANAEMPKPSITMPNAVSSRPGFDDEEGSNASPKHAQSNQQQSQATGQQQRSTGADQPPAKKGQPAKDAKPGANNQGSGWFGGIWNKLSLKPKNQMILPDDKNPTIVWDPDKKRWVNTEGDTAGEESFKPPPKMADLMPAGAAPPPPQAPTPGPPAPAPVMAISAPSPGYGAGSGAGMSVDPAASSLPTGSAAAPQGAAAKVGEPTKVPTLQSNMFKMQRNRTLKKSYVDVFNPSGAAPSRPTESIMAPAVPTMPTPQGGFFVPGPAPAGGQTNESAAEGVPQFYNPNQYAGGYQQ